MGWASVLVTCFIHYFQDFNFDFVFLKNQDPSLTQQKTGQLVEMDKTKPNWLQGKEVWYFTRVFFFFLFYLKWKLFDLI